MKKINEIAEGIVIMVKVIPGSSINQIIGWEKDYLKIRLTTAPEKGKANKALIDLINKKWKVPKKDVVILSGEKSRLKKILIKGKKERDLIY